MPDAVAFSTKGDVAILRGPLLSGGTLQQSFTLPLALSHSPDLILDDVTVMHVGAQPELMFLVDSSYTNGRLELTRVPVVGGLADVSSAAAVEIAGEGLGDSWPEALRLFDVDGDGVEELLVTYRRSVISNAVTAAYRVGATTLSLIGVLDWGLMEHVANASGTVIGVQAVGTAHQLGMWQLQALPNVDQDHDRHPDACGLRNSVEPGAIGNRGTATLVLRPDPPLPGALSVVLIGPDGIAHESTDITVAKDGAVIVARVNVDGLLPLGTYRVTVRSGGGLIQIGTIELQAPVDAVLGVEVHTRTDVRRGTPTTVLVAVSNDGNVESAPALLDVAFPTGTDIEAPNGFVTPPDAGGISPKEVPPVIVTDKASHLPVFIPTVPPKGHVYLPLRATFNSTGDADVSATLRPGLPQSFGQPPGSPAVSGDCIAEWASFFGKKTFEQLAAGGVLTSSQRQCAQAIGGLFYDVAYATYKSYATKLSPFDVAMAQAQVAVGTFGASASCVIALTELAVPEVQVVAKVAENVGLVLDGVQIFDACQAEVYKAAAHLKVGAPKDPNELTGPDGACADRRLMRGSTLAYDLFVENAAEATAAAGKINVIFASGGADAASAVVEQLRLGSRWIRIDRRIPFDITVDDAVLGIAVRFSAKGGSTQLVLELQALDRTTRMPIDDPAVGLLPPEDGSGRGQGQIVLSLGPQSAASADARAAIIFDAEMPIETNEWANRLVASSGELACSDGTCHCDVGRPSPPGLPLPTVLLLLVVVRLARSKVTRSASAGAARRSRRPSSRR